VALMANDGLRHEIRFEKHHENVDQSDEYSNHNANQVTASVTFTSGGRLKAKFTFELSEENYNSQKLKKIQSLHIQFIE
jgi:hypothetical protein